MTNSGDELNPDARRQLGKMFVNMAEQMPIPKAVTLTQNFPDPNPSLILKAHTERPNDFVATLFLPGGDGITRQNANTKQMNGALRGQASGCTAIQRLVALKHSSSVYRNTYELQQGSVHANQHTMVASNTLPGIGRKGKMCDFAAVYREEKCLVNALNKLLNTATRRIVRQIEHKLCEENEIHFRQHALRTDLDADPTRQCRVLRLTVEYVEDHRGMIWMSHIKELYTCESTEPFQEAKFIDPAPNPKALLNLNKALSYWETYWMVAPLEGKYMATEPHELQVGIGEPAKVDLGLIPGTQFKMQPYQEWRAMPEKQVLFSAPKSSCVSVSE